MSELNKFCENTSGLILICRLCGTATDSYTNIFGYSDSNHSISDKILTYLRLEISNSDLLPKVICNRCFNKLEDFHNFFLTSRKTQLLLKNTISKSLHSIKTVIKPDNKICSNNFTKLDQDTLLFDNENIVSSNKAIDININDNILENQQIFNATDDKVNIVNNFKDFVKQNDQETFQNDEANEINTIDSVTESEDSWIYNKIDKNIISELETNFINVPINLPCIICTKLFTSPKEMIDHYEQQHCNSVPIFKCTICGNMFKILKNFCMHYQKHNSVHKHICEICGKSFTRNWTLRVHATVHTDEKPFNCTECNKTFKSFSTLKNHMKTHLPDECKLIYTCAFCDKRFKSKFILTKHEKRHTGQKDYTCDICGKSFSSKSILLQHIKIHNYDEELKCPLCNKIVKNEQYLKKHLEFHNSKKPFSCEYCGKEYCYSSQLNEHRRIHTGELPYKCEYCHKRFRLSETLVIHRRQHTGEKPYKCEVCNHSFTNWPNYNKHMKRKHYNTIIEEKNDDLILLKI